MKVIYNGMYGKDNTHTKTEVKELVKTWDENKLKVQYGFGWKGATPRKATREEAINYDFFEAYTDNEGNLVLVKYGENDFY